MRVVTGKLKELKIDLPDIDLDIAVEDENVSITLDNFKSLVLKCRSGKPISSLCFCSRHTDYAQCILDEIDTLILGNYESHHLYPLK